LTGITAASRLPRLRACRCRHAHAGNAHAGNAHAGDAHAGDAHAGDAHAGDAVPHFRSHYKGRDKWKNRTALTVGRR
jgi:hypothetical protein